MVLSNPESLTKVTLTNLTNSTAQYVKNLKSGKTVNPQIIMDGLVK